MFNKVDVSRALVFILCLSIIAVQAPNSVFAVGEANPEVQVDLKQAIDEKSKELDELSNQIKQTQNDLTQIGSQKQTLNRDLKKIDYTLNQVNLSIKSTEVNISKLGLELQDLNEKLGSVEESIALKRMTVAETLNMLNRKDREGVLQIFLKSESLVQGAFEAQALRDIQDQLAVNIHELKKLQGTLNETIDEKSNKRRQLETATKTLKVRKTIAEEEKNERNSLLAQTKGKEQIYQQKLTELQKKQQELADEIEEIENRLRGRINADTIPKPRAGVLENPAPGGYLTQEYGKTSFARRAYRSGSHNGIDIARFKGSEILASEDGVVVAVGDQDRYCWKQGYGRFIVVKHFNGLTTLYAHLSSYIVKAGQEVSRGQLIGYMGSTGYATGTHLHFGVYDSNNFEMMPHRCSPMPIGAHLDPFDYLFAI